MEHSSHLVYIVGGLVLLLVIAAASLGLSKRIKIPFTILLVLVGIGLSSIGSSYPQYLGLLADFDLTPALILYVFLPTLIFESALSLDVRQLQRSLIPVLTMAVPGLLLSTAMIGMVVWMLTPLSPGAAFLLGAILSATDPVAVIALFKKLGAPGRLTVLVEGESLLNDATALVLARLLVSMIAAGVYTLDAALAGAADFLVVFLGGSLVGLVAGIAFSWVLGQVEGDYYIEVTLTTVLAYCSFLLAEEVLHVSGIMATLVAGIVLTGWGRTKISSSVSEYMTHFWEYLAFLANALIFLLVGMQIDLALLLKTWPMLVCVILAMLLARFAVVYGLLPAITRLTGSDAIDHRFKAVMYWGGLRGAVALAIVLSLPEFAFKDTLVTLVTGAVLFTLLVQGLSIEWLIARLGLNRPTLADRLAHGEGVLRAQHGVQEQIPQLEKSGHFSARVAQHMRDEAQRTIDTLHADIQALRTGLSADEEYSLLLMRCLSQEKRGYHALFDCGHISERAFRELLHLVMTQLNGLRFHGHLPRDSFGRFSARRVHRAVVHVLSRFRILTPLVQRLRAGRMMLDYDTAWARNHVQMEVLDSLDQMAQDLSASPETAGRIKAMYQRWNASANDELSQVVEQFPEFVESMQERLAERLALLAGIASIEQAARDGTLPEGVADHLVAQQRQALRRLRGPNRAALEVAHTDLLRCVELVRNLPESDFQMLLQNLVLYTVPRNEIVIEQGETVSSLYLIARGQVQIFRQTADGEQVIAELRAGEFFGEMGILTGREQHSASVRAVTPCSIYELKRQPLQDLIEQHPSLGQRLREMQALRGIVVDQSNGVGTEAS